MSRVYIHKKFPEYRLRIEPDDDYDGRDIVGIDAYVEACGDSVVLIGEDVVLELARYERYGQDREQVIVKYLERFEKHMRKKFPNYKSNGRAKIVALIEYEDDKYIAFWNTWGGPDPQKTVDGVLSEVDTLEREGAYGFILEKEVKCDHCGHVDYEEIDSCWGFIGWDSLKYMVEDFPDELKEIDDWEWASE